MSGFPGISSSVVTRPGWTVTILGSMMQASATLMILRKSLAVESPMVCTSCSDMMVFSRIMIRKRKGTKKIHHSWCIASTFTFMKRCKVSELYVSTNWNNCSGSVLVKIRHGYSGSIWTSFCSTRQGSFWNLHGEHHQSSGQTRSSLRVRWGLQLHRLLEELCH